MKRALFITLGIIVALPLIVIAMMRLTLHNFDKPTTVKPGLNEVVGGGVRVFATKIGNKAVLFDAGIDPEGKGIDALLSSIQASRNDVSDIFISHGHVDHRAAIPLFPQAKVHAGADDAGWLAGTTQSKSLVMRFFSSVIPTTTSTLTDPLHDIVEVPLGEGRSVKCFPSPGHTPGSYDYLYDGVLFVGDTMMLDGDHFKLAPAFLNTDTEQELASIKKLKTTLQNENIDQVCTAHGGCTPSGQGHKMFDAFVTTLGG